MPIDRRRDDRALERHSLDTTQTVRNQTVDLLFDPSSDADILSYHRIVDTSNRRCQI